MIPEFIFEWIALNPRTATGLIVGFGGICSVAVWIGFLKEMNSEQGN